MKAPLFTSLAPLALAALSGCGHLSLETHWAPAQLLKYDASQYTDDAAVGLFAEDGRLIARRSSDPPYTQALVHRAYAIQNERAFELAEVRVPLYGKNKLIALKARHLKPDGTVREIQPSEVIVDESESSDGKATNGRVFRFPNVEIGSVLEWVYVIEMPFIDTDDESPSLGEYPMRRYEAWIEASKEIILEGRFYNLPAQTQAGPGRDPNFKRISATLVDIPARPKREQFAADWTFTQPRWAYRMLHWNVAGHVTPVLETWEDVIGRWAFRAWATSKDALLEKFDERLDVGSCTDLRCRVERALAWVDQHTEYSGIGSFARMRKATEIVRSRQASSFERALLMRRLLEDTGMIASLAAYTSLYTRQIDPGFPNLERFNRVLLYVPPQPGLAQALWVDPACQHCALGQVSDEARGIKARVFRALIQPLGDPVYSSDERVVEAPGDAPPTRVVTYQATVTPSGDLAIDVTDARSGRWAAARCADLRATSAAMRVSNVRRDLVSVAATAKLIALPPFECRPTEGRLWEQRKILLPEHAVFEKDHLYVPLTLFEPIWAGTFVEEKRLQPIAFESGDRTTEFHLQLKAPPGWALAGGARSETATAPGARASLELKPSADGAEARLELHIDAGYYEAADYPAYRKLAEFVRDARTRMIELVKR
jgi:hypothetical protein